MAKFGKSTFHLLKNITFRSCHLQIRGLKSEIELKPTSLNLTISSGSCFEVDFFWLRDHCRCPNCYNQATSQRSLPLLSISPSIKPHSCRFSADNKSHLLITWEDGHKSEYDCHWLEKYLEPKSRQNKLNKMHTSRKLWPKENSPKLPKINYFDLVEKSDQAVLEQTLMSLLEHGIAFIEQVPRTVEATQMAVEKIAPVQHTFFGGMWEFGTKTVGQENTHEDTAYSSEALDPHNDSTYFTESTGLQVFHCLERSKNCQGGETRLVDGMAAAQLLKEKDPRAYELLSSVAIDSEYKESGKHHVGQQPVIVLDPVTQKPLQIRFNLYDRAPLCTLESAKAVREYYLALRKLSEIMFSEKFEMRMALGRGQVIMIDNWRILHGRTAFTGQRHMTGCYVSRSDWLSTARLLNLI